MRALFSSVLAGLLFITATGVRAQVPRFAAGAGEDLMASGATRAERARGAPRVTMDLQTWDSRRTLEFTVTIRFTRKM